jgi:hypothetical protein
LSFVDGDGREHTVGASLLDTFTDGIVVMHKGRVVFERYFGALTAERPHACFSITKSYVGTLAAAFVHERALDSSKLIPHYLPELGGTAWDDASLRQVMDMECGLDFSEDYDQVGSGVRRYMQSAGLRPRPAGSTSADSIADFLKSVRKCGEHGTEHAYKTVNTEVLAWVMSRVTGLSLSELLHARFWEPLACEEDGYLVVDAAGMEMAGGGLNTTVRDLARFGELMRCEGAWRGMQVIPPSVTGEIQRGGDRQRFARAGYKTSPGYSYKSMWYTTHNELGAFEARGIHGQRLYIAPRAEMVVARLASHPLAAANGVDLISPRMFAAIADLLRA